MFSSVAIDAVSWPATISSKICDSRCENQAACTSPELKHVLCRRTASDRGFWWPEGVNVPKYPPGHCGWPDKQPSRWCSSRKHAVHANGDAETVAHRHVVWGNVAFGFERGRRATAPPPRQRLVLVADLDEDLRPRRNLLLLQQVRDAADGRNAARSRLRRNLERHEWRRRVIASRSLIRGNAIRGTDREHGGTDAAAATAARAEGDDIVGSGAVEFELQVVQRRLA